MLFRIWLTLQLLNHLFQCQTKATVDARTSRCQPQRVNHNRIRKHVIAFRRTSIPLKWPLFNININSSSST
jgi:hypothetical protein